jgi:HPr(Ser) kinase/phosphatase
VAVRNYILQLRGKDSMKEFLERHQSIMKEQEVGHENHPD